jgi:hypothetical protein
MNFQGACIDIVLLYLHRPLQSAEQHKDHVLNLANCML